MTPFHDSFGPVSFAPPNFIESLFIIIIFTIVFSCGMLIISYAVLIWDRWQERRREKRMFGKRIMALRRVL